MRAVEDMLHMGLDEDCAALLIGCSDAGGTRGSDEIDLDGVGMS